MTSESPLLRLANRVLGQPVVPWVRARRPGISWRKIAIELRDATGGEIDVPPQTLMNWAPDERVEEREARAS